MIFDELQLWIDPGKHSGPVAMAIDEWLLNTAERPVLRIYRWQENWASLGYFGKIEEAKAIFPGVNWVRRWTGGGIVDHRSDWTYTLVAPEDTAVARWKGVEIYRSIHQALAKALAEEGIGSSLSTGHQETGAADCFSNPVGSDLINADGEKIAGAGQRRSKRGLLYQGSVAAPYDRSLSKKRAENFARHLSRNWRPVEFFPVLEENTKFADSQWTGRR